jgi:hypothetical protein
MVTLTLGWKPDEAAHVQTEAPVVGDAAQVQSDAPAAPRAAPPVASAKRHKKPSLVRHQKQYQQRLRQQQRRPHADAAHTLTVELLTRWPNAFSQPPKPLAIGTSKAIQAAMSDVPTAVLDAAMHLWVTQPAYRRAVAQQGAMRVALDGTPVEPVSERDAASMRKWLTPFRGRGPAA